jgi:hypothetical protein
MFSLVHTTVGPVGKLIVLKINPILTVYLGRKILREQSDTIISSAFPYTADIP